MKTVLIRTKSWRGELTVNQVKKHIEVGRLNRFVDISENGRDWLYLYHYPELWSVGVLVGFEDILGVLSE